MNEALNAKRQELLAAGVKAMVESMKQMGLTLSQAQDTIAEFWEVEE